jgi:transporter family protein
MPTYIYFAILSMLFAGLTAVIAKFGLKDIPADLGLAIRTAIVFILVVLNFLAWHNINTIKQVAPKAFLFLAISGLTTSLSWIFYYRAIKVGDVSVVAIIDKASIVITLALSFWLLKEPFTIRVVVAGLFIVTGLLILIWK